MHHWIYTGHIQQVLIRTHVHLACLIDTLFQLYFNENILCCQKRHHFYSDESYKITCSLLIYLSCQIQQLIRE